MESTKYAKVAATPPDDVVEHEFKEHDRPEADGDDDDQSEPGGQILQWEQESGTFDNHKSATSTSVGKHTLEPA
jgi:hypothetical protein